MKSQDIRWHQRLENFTAAFDQLKQAVLLSQTKSLTNLEKQGLIHAFEFTHELAWNVLKDFFLHQGQGDRISGSRDATREGFKQNLLVDGDAWMEMIQSRNQTSHTYNKDIADGIVEKITTRYFAAFSAFLKEMTDRRDDSN